jgi:hypothetical protein
MTIDVDACRQCNADAYSVLKEVLMDIDRRGFVKHAGLGGIVLVSAAGCSIGGDKPSGDEFYFVQLSDTHWGFEGAAVNPSVSHNLMHHQYPTRTRGDPLCQLL